MKHTIKFLTLAIFFIGFISCSDDEGENIQDIESNSVTNLQATQTSDYQTNPPTITGDYIKFSFESGATTTGDDWDVAFRGTTILVNGGEATAEDQPERTGNAGAYIASGTLATVTDVDTDLFTSDSSTSGLAIPTGSDNGWYNYNSTTHLITPIAGKVIVIKTVDGKYAKFEILSYYEDGTPAADLSNSQYYSFDYVYQPNEGVETF